MKKEWKKTHTIYWKDELNDDFDEVGLTRISVPENYNYIRKGFFYNLCSNILYFVIAVPILAFYTYVILGIRTKGKKNLKEVKKTGAYLYANHVAISDVFKIQVLITPSKRTNIIGYSDSLSNKFLGKVVKMLGYIALPLRNDPKNFIKMNEALSYYTKKKHQYVLIYPEAHIWPYYTEIRNFKPGSFRYPSNDNMPVVPIVTTFHKRKLSKKPRQIIRVGKPIFPKEGLSPLENISYLHEKTLKAMKELSNVDQYQYIKYLKTPLDQK